MGMDYEDFQKVFQLEKPTSGVFLLEQLTQMLIEELKPSEGQKILNVEVGTGRLGMVLSNIAPKGMIVGIDSGYSRTKIIRRRFSRHKVKNFSIVRGKAESLPFLTGCFDYACFLFSHFSQPLKAIEEIYRVLKPGGCLVSVEPILKEPVDEEDKKLNRFIEETFQIAHGPEYRLFTGKELRALYEHVGFSIESCKAHDAPFRHKGIEEVPMGSQWLQTYESLLLKNEMGLLRRFERNYFTFREIGGRLGVEGVWRWAIVKAIK
ncbi:MAG: class I SAM-dependent methyltransferase [Candidatus Methanospirareceae archaeon]